MSFTAEAANLASDVNIYLEDRLNTTFTKLDNAGGAFTFTPNTAIDGVGRFYLHATSSVLSTSNEILEGVSIYSVNKTLRISGLSNENAEIKLFTILGKQVVSKSITTKEGNNTIDVSNLSNGVYLVQLTTKEGTLNKKVVLQ